MYHSQPEQCARTALQLLAIIGCSILALTVIVYKLESMLCPLHLERKTYKAVHGQVASVTPNKSPKNIDAPREFSLDMMLADEEDEDNEQKIDLRLRSKSMPALNRASIKVEDRLTRKSLTRLHKV